MARRRASTKKTPIPFWDRPDLVEYITRVMGKAVRKAIAENDRLGIPSPYGKDGKVHYRQPPKRRKAHRPLSKS